MTRVTLQDDAPAFPVYYDTEKLWAAGTLERLAALRRTSTRRRQ